MNLWSSESQSTFWLHPSHQLPMRTAAITVALLTLGVVMATALPPPPETRSIASNFPRHTLLDPSPLNACVRLFQGKNIA